MEKDQNSGRQQETGRWAGARGAAIGGLLAGSLALVGQLLIGQVYGGSETQRLIESSLPSIRTLASSVVTATGTILALMLTLLSLTQSVSQDFDQAFFKRVERIGMASTVGMIGATLTLLILSIPLQEGDAVNVLFYQLYYYLIIALAASLAGILISVVIILFTTIRGLLAALSPIDYGDDYDPLVAGQDE